MLDIKIPFEIHITTDNFTSDRQADFVDFCITREAKPLMIELSKGDFINQPMFSKIIFANNLGDILSISTEISNSLNNHGFLVKRLKIEIPSDKSDLLKYCPSDFDRYFEWHCKINFTQTDSLLKLCEKHKVHLSLNSLKNEANIRFITLREFGTKLRFEQRILSLLSGLQNGKWTILKQQSEYCVYDNNNFLDNGWLPQ
jgi:hypothetical protein